ncbi:DUF397 domain-containing protein [Streptomyces sp. NPDC051563]|uniref:DUF397 domain-containing protein n=1 Tax=Streptomyces sp. NPDC051563 TaxID=3365659 RepID=UPI0037BC2FD7
MIHHPELDWFKSSYSSSSDGNDCVEVAQTPSTIHVRDSKDIHQPHLTLNPHAWADFVASHALPALRS